MNKTNMNKNKILYVILTILVVILMLCISTEVVYRVNKSEEPKINVDSLKNVIKQKDSILFEVTEERDFYKLQAEEMGNEIGYEIDPNILP
jgi:hypothetical protein